jgi:hypothetical protein
MSVSFTHTGPFAGYFKYTAVLNWSTQQGLSNITLDCGFGECPDLVCAETFLFDIPAGTGEGEGGCEAEFEGEFNCNGNPSIGFSDPVLKWDAIGECKPGHTGSVTICFYTNLAPRADRQAPITLIKNGQQICQGMITGDCPAAPCVVGTEVTTWGEMKGKYR